MNIKIICLSSFPDIIANAEGKTMVPLVAYNPLGWLVRRLMPVNVSSPNVSVIDIHGRNIGSQVGLKSGSTSRYKIIS